MNASVARAEFMINATRTTTGDRARSQWISGPKLRTGPLIPGLRVVRVKPKRDSLRRCSTPALIRISTSFETSTTVNAEESIVPNA
jgi:hypothetical protein